MNPIIFLVQHVFGKELNKKSGFPRIRIMRAFLKIWGDSNINVRGEKLLKIAKSYGFIGVQAWAEQAQFAYSTYVHVVTVCVHLATCIHHAIHQCLKQIPFCSLTRRLFEFSVHERCMQRHPNASS